MVYANYKDTLTYLEERADTLGVDHDFEKWHLEVGKQYVTTVSLNVRSGPGTQYTVIGGLSRGQIVSVVSISAEGWAEINSPMRGFCNAWYLFPIGKQIYWGENNDEN